MSCVVRANLEDSARRSRPEGPLRLPDDGGTSETVALLLGGALAAAVVAVALLALWALS